MEKLKQIIQTIIPKEIEQDKGVFSGGYVLEPYLLHNALRGDGQPQEVVTAFQLDFFYRNKGELLAKTKELNLALGDYPITYFSITWEGTARLWRATATIETL